MAKRQNDFQSMQDLMKTVIQENNLTRGMQQILVTEAWAKIMGKGVVSYTSGLNLRGNVLYIQLKSAVLREELSYGKDKIIKMLNEELGENLISKIVLN